MRTWQVARKRTFTNTSGQLGLKVEGDTAVGGYSNVVVWGVNRRGTAFYTQLTTPLTFNSQCTSRPVSGIKVHNGLVKSISVTFGVDESGNPYSGTGCPYGQKRKCKNCRCVLLKKIFQLKKATSNGSLFLWSWPQCCLKIC
jgi:hypothetical protein